MNDKEFYCSSLWTHTKLEDILKLFDSGLWGENPDESSSYYVIRSTDFDELGRISLQNTEKRKIPNDIIIKKYLKNGDILLNKSSGSEKHIGKIIYYELENKYEKHYFSNFIQRLRVNEKLVDNKYIYYNLDYKRTSMYKYTQTSSGLKNIDLNGYKKQKIEIPPLVEQRGIAEVLGTVDEAIRRTDAVIAKAEELKQGLMQRLLTRGIGHTKFKPSELGEIPEAWEVSTIGNECSVGTGGTPSRKNPEYFNGDIPWVKTTELNHDIILSTEEKITQKALEESNAKFYPKGTLLIAMYGLEAEGTRGKCAILGIDAATNQACAAIQPLNRIHTPFLFYFYQSMGDRIMVYTGGTKRMNLSLGIVKSIKIPVPPMNEQIKISDVITEIDSNIKIEKKNRNQKIKLKEGLMQVLLTGRVRVRLDEGGLHRVRDG